MLLVVIAFHFLIISSCIKQIFPVIVYINQVIGFGSLSVKFRFLHNAFWGNNNCRDLRWTEFSLTSLHICRYVWDFWLFKTGALNLTNPLLFLRDADRLRWAIIELIFNWSQCLLHTCCDLKLLVNCEYLCWVVKTVIYVLLMICYWTVLFTWD